MDGIDGGIRPVLLGVGSDPENEDGADERAEGGNERYGPRPTEMRRCRPPPSPTGVGTV